MTVNEKIIFFYRKNWCNLCPRAGSTQMRKVNIKAKRKKERMEERKRKTTTKTNFKETALP